LEGARTGRTAFCWVDRFIPTGFSRRLLELLDLAFATRHWYVVFGQSGDGKSTTLRQFVSLNKAERLDGVRVVPVLAARVPTGHFAADHLVQELAAGLGTVPRLRMNQMRHWLVDACIRHGVTLIVIDDAHELRTSQLNYLRELTDQLKDRGHEVGVVLLCVTDGGEPKTQPVWRLIVTSGLETQQFSNRLDGTDPIVLVESLSKVEVGRVLRTLETFYRETFPELALACWTKSMFEWLTDPRIDSAHMGRVRMKAIRQVVEAALAEAWAKGMTGLDPQGEMLRTTAICLAVRGADYSVLPAEDKPDRDGAAA
jgi:energy-coupling factor transporter ATP-binding protein EcfA2